MVAAFLAIIFVGGGANDADVTSSHEVDGNGNSYDVSNGVLTISKGTDGSGILGPFSKVKSVKNMELDNFTSVEFGSDITEIGDFTFYGCKALRKPSF